MSPDVTYDFEDAILGALHAAQMAPSTFAQRRLRRLVPAGVGAAAVGVASIISITVIGGGAGPLAGWTATASAATTSETANAAAVCQLEIQRPDDGSTWQLVSSEQRGPYTLVVYDAGGSTASCLTGPSTKVFSFEYGGTNPSKRVVAAFSSAARAGNNSWGLLVSGDDRVAVGHLGSGDQQDVTIIEGTVADNVSAVSFTRADGTLVEGTVNNGAVVAWWPGGADPTSMTKTSPGGTTTEALSRPDATVPGACSSIGADDGTAPCPSSTAAGNSGSPTGSSGTTVVNSGSATNPIDVAPLNAADGNSGAPTSEISANS